MNAAKGSSFLEGLDDEARELLLSVASPVSFLPGALVVRQGETARGAYILREGTVEARVAMPGGESMVVATMGPGSVFGEMALIELGTTTATIRAASPVDGWFVAHEDFRALVSQSRPAALRLQHAVTAILAEKVAALNARLLGIAAPEDRAARATRPGIDPLLDVPRARRASFDARPFLQRLPLFERCSADDIDDLVAPGSYLELPRGHGVFAADTEASAAFIVVRGAVEIVAVRDGLERRIAILGPGQLVGYLSVLRRARHSSHAFAREGSVLLELPAQAFHDLYFGSGHAPSRLRQAVQASLLAAMARTNRALTRLISHAKLGTSRHDEAALEVARASLIATASPV